jgi:hypothetical protein
VATLEQQIEVMERYVRQADGWATRWVIPVVVPNYAATQGPWAKNAAIQYARTRLNLDTPGLASTGGLTRPYDSYRPAAHAGPTDLKGYQELATDAQVAQIEAAHGARDERYVVEVVVDGGVG